MKKVSYDEFVTALAREMKGDSVIIDSQLQEFMESLQSVLKEEGKVSIEGVGEFILTKGHLSFEPEETLALEVNFKYAGMEAIEIMPAYAKKLKKDEPDDALDQEKDQLLTPLQTSGKEDSSAKENSDKSVGPKSSEKEESKSVPNPSEEIDDDDPFNLSGPETKAISKSESDPERKKEPEAKPKRVKKTAERSAENKRKEKEQEGTEGQPRSNAAFFTVAAIAAVLLVALYIYQADDLPFDLPGIADTGVITRQEPEDSNPPAASNHELRQGDLPKVDDEETGPDNTETTDSSATTSAITTSTTTVSAEAEDTVFGIYGDLAEVNRPFTIVVHSLPYRQASSERDKLKQSGYRATLSSVTKDNGYETWRVGIGQFETIEDATEAIQRLGEPYKSNNFVARIRR
ncbi:MAG: SPOR domain-containing protein [Balneolales bacterium]